MVDRLPAAPGTLWSSTEPTLPAYNGDAFKTAPGRNIFVRIFNRGAKEERRPPGKQAAAIL